MGAKDITLALTLSSERFEVYVADCCPLNYRGCEGRGGTREGGSRELGKGVNGASTKG